MLEAIGEIFLIILGIAVVVAALFGFIIFIDNVSGLAQEREEYKAKCEASGGVVITARDMPKKCMKKEFFIPMEK